MTDRTGILPKQPLFYVLASLRFQRWLSLPARIGEIQEELRERLPLFNQIYRGDTGAGFASQGPTGEPVAWAFHAPDRSAGCQITHDQIVVHTTRYTRFPEFAEMFGFVMAIVERHAKRFDVGAVGIRYLDRIEPGSGETLADYLPPEYLPKPLPGTTLVAESGLSQTVYRTPTGLLQARVWSGPQYVSVPDDLVPLFVLTQEFGSNGIALPALHPGHGILDSDSIWTSSTPVQMNAMKTIEILAALHEHSNAFFRNVCTDHAFRRWRGEL